MMRTFLLTYNPERWLMQDGEWLSDLEAVRAGARVGGRWSTGTRTDMDIGARVYLLTQGPEPRGIVASGWTIDEPDQDEHWDGEGGVANYVEVEWDAMVPIDEPYGLRTSSPKCPRCPGCGFRRSMAGRLTRRLAGSATACRRAPR